MAAEMTPDQLRAIERRGISPLRPSQALRQLVHAWDRPHPQVMIGQVGWDAFLADRPAPEAFYADVTTGGTEIARTEFDLDALVRRPAGERPAVLGELLRERVAAVLHYDCADDIEPDAKFLSLGLDSLAAVELKNALEAALGIPLATSLLFDYPRIDALAGYLCGVLTGESHSPDSPDAVQPGIRPAAADLTEAEADAELAALRDPAL
jgi:myxalamid-type polyketide synthase MxaB